MRWCAPKRPATTRSTTGVVNGLKGTGSLVTLGIEVYFAKPYHPWERGANENRNGVVRKVLPKGRSFGDTTEEEMRRIDYMPNAA
ncbi:MAG: hypothetical protein J6T51_01490 [Kiritimatiellae bacterium]|nr:hypothetical protein [Kiritimatiellia bacterium]